MHKPTRWLPALLLLVLLCSCGLPSTARADLRDRDAWRVLIAQEGVEDAVAWQRWLVGADDGGGLLLVDPSTGELQGLDTRDGLGSNRTTCLAVDDEDRLWVGTSGAGIVRLDAAFSPRSVTGLIDLEVQAIAVDGDAVYYGTPSGGGRIVGGVPEFTFTVEEGLPSDVITAIAAYQDEIWYGTDAGVARFSRELQRFESHNEGLGVGDELRVVDLLCDARGIFAATSADVLRFDPEGGQWEPAASGLDEPVRQLATLGEEIVALGQGSRIWRLPALATSWTPETLITEDLELLTLTEGPEGQLWFGGYAVDPEALRSDPRSMFWRPGLAEPHVSRGLFGAVARGLSTDGAGGVWVGTQPTRGGLTHWRSDGGVVAYNRAGEVGWCSGDSKNDILRTRDGDLWVSSFTRCVTRLRPAADDDPVAGEYLNLTPDNSPLASNRVVRIEEDPAGRIWFLSDGLGDDPSLHQGVDILLDPDGDVFDPTNWLKVSSSNSRLANNVVKGVRFEGSGAAWFSLPDVGLQRWNFDGFAQTGEIDLSTLLNGTFWSEIDAVGGTSLLKPGPVAITAEGDLWASSEGEGVVRFRWAEGLGILEVVDRVFVTSFGPTLLSGDVRDLALDRSGALWVATDAGLDRITGSRSDLRVDAFTDLAAFLGRNLGQNYTTEILSPLPGSNVRRLEYDADAHRLYVATQTGAARIDLGLMDEAVDEGLEFFVYPNPYRGGGDPGAIRVGGFDGVADVQIYNLLGVLLAERSGVEEGDGVWDTRDIADAPVASGMYVVRLIRDGESAQRTLAVER